MAISNVSLTNTFDEWRVTTNQLIVVTNDLLGDGLQTYRSVTANVVTANNLFFGSLNVVSTLSSSFDQSNVARTQANGAFANANSAGVIASAAFDAANAAGSSAAVVAAFDKANTAVLKTGNTMTGNLVMSSANIAFVTNTNSGIYWGGTGLSFLYSSNANTLVLGTSFREQIKLDSQGRFGLGVSSPRAKFDMIGTSAGQITTLTDAATITPDFSSNNNFVVTLGGNRTLANATNATIGQSGLIYILQDGTGNRTLALGLAYKFASNDFPVFTTSANAVDVIVYSVRTANSYVCQALLEVGNTNDT